jgi:hypothetical protein
MVSGTTSGFGRNQIYLKLKLGTPQFMPGIKNLNLNFFELAKKKKYFEIFEIFLLKFFHLKFKKKSNYKLTCRYQIGVRY